MRSVWLEHCFTALPGANITEAVTAALELLDILEPMPDSIYLIFNATPLQLVGKTAEEVVAEYGKLRF